MVAEGFLLSMMISRIGAGARQRFRIIEIEQVIMCCFSFAQ